MKKGLFILGFLVLCSCVQRPEEKEEPKVENVTESLPKVELKVNVLSKAENQDERFGTESSVEVVLYIDGQKTDTYFDYGDGNFIENTLFLSSEVSEKSYTIHAEKETVKIVYVVYGSTEFMEFDDQGEPIPLSTWETSYSKNGSSWKKTGCEGDCE